MDAIKEIDRILADLYASTSSIFVGLYYKESVVSFKTTKYQDGRSLAEIVSLLVRKFINSSDLIGKPEFLFTEGEGYAIFMYEVDDDITLVDIVDGKPNFSLLKLENEKAAKQLKAFSTQIPGLLEALEQSKEEEQQPETPELPEEQLQSVSEAPQQEPEKQEEQKQQPALELDEDIKQLEEILSSGAEEIEEKTQQEEQTKEEVVEEKDEEVEEVVEETPEEPVSEEEEEVAEEESAEKEQEPSLEELLIEDEPVDREIVNNINIKFIEEVGPVGKLLFKKTVEKIGLNIENPTRLKVENLINALADEIIVEDRKQKFIDFCKNLLGKS